MYANKIKKLTGKELFEAITMTPQDSVLGKELYDEFERRQNGAKPIKNQEPISNISVLTNDELIRCAEFHSIYPQLARRAADELRRRVERDGLPPSLAELEGRKESQS